MGSVSANGESPSTEDSSSDSGGITGFFTSGFSCLSGKTDPSCIQRIFLLMSLFGTFLSLIGGIFSLLYRFCSCFMCCRRKPRRRPGNEANNSNKQLELMKMQMQMQQQQMCNTLMRTALTNRGEKNKGKKKGGKKKKKNDSSNETKKPRKKNLKDNIYVGYQKEQE